MKKLTTIVALSGLLLTQVSGVATAQTSTPAAQPVSKPAPAPVKVTLTQDQIRTSTSGGKSVETVIPSPKTVLPGDVLREEITVQNLVAKPVKNPVVSVPVPKGTVYLGSATPSSERWNTQFSIDSGKTYTASPLKTVTVTENGKSVTKQIPAPITEYTNVRWTIAQLAPSESLKLSFRVKIN
jgi:hypothetical protein